MRRSQRVLSLCPALLVAAACASGTPASAGQPSPDRILFVDADGSVLRQSTTDEMARMTFAAPLGRVWDALVSTYTELGIQPSIVDVATGRYGNTGFAAPREMAGRPLRTFFGCGTTMTGPLVDQGRLTANVVTTVSPGPNGTTVAVTHVTATLRRNDGTSTSPIPCASTGALEEYLRTATEKRLAVAR